MSQYCGLCEKQCLSDAICLKEVDEHQQYYGSPGLEDSPQNLGWNGEPEAQPASNQDVTAATSEEKNLSQNQTVGSLTEGVSLATLLFRACDVCIYCGGKFMG